MASESMPNSPVRVTSSGIRLMPSSMLYSVWTCRWVNDKGRESSGYKPPDPVWARDTGLSFRVNWLLYRRDSPSSANRNEASLYRRDQGRLSRWFSTETTRYWGAATGHATICNRLRGNFSGEDGGERSGRCHQKNRGPAPLCLSCGRRTPAPCRLRRWGGCLGRAFVGYSSSRDSMSALTMALTRTGSCRLISRVSPQVAVST